MSKSTIVKLLAELGEACSDYRYKHIRNLASERVQCDEIWSFCYAMKANLTPAVIAEHPGAGDVWTWTPIDADTKLIISWPAGSRDMQSATRFLRDVNSRLAFRVQSQGARSAHIGHM